MTWHCVFWTAVGLLAYGLVGYGLMLCVLSAFVRRRPCGECEPEVTLIIPAHNEQQVLEAKLHNALSLEYPMDKLQIVVASDASTDATEAIARQFESRGVEVLAFAQRRGKQAVLTDAVRSARGEVLCLCDANVMFRPDALRRLVRRLSDPRVGAVTGEVRIASHQSNFGEGESFYYRIERRLQSAESDVGSLMGVDGGMYVIRRELFPSLPADTILDDFVISMRVVQQGFGVVYEPQAVADENGTPAARQEWRRRVRVSAGAAQTLLRRQWPPLRRPVELWQYLSHKLLRWLGPVWLGMALVASGVLAVQHTADVTVWVYRGALAAQAGLYLTAAAAAFSLRLRATGLGGITFYFVMSYAAMAVGLLKGLINRQPVAWQRTDRGGQVGLAVPPGPGSNTI